MKILLTILASLLFAAGLAWRLNEDPKGNAFVFFMDYLLGPMLIPACVFSGIILIIGIGYAAGCLVKHFNP